MKTINQLNELNILIQSRIPLLQIETTEEMRLLKFLEMTALEKKWDLYIWTVTLGLKKINEKTAIGKTGSLKEALQYIKDNPKTGIFVMLDYQLHLTDLISQRLIKEIAQTYALKPLTLLFIGSHFDLPDDLNRLFVKFKPSLPSASQIRDVFAEEAHQWLNAESGRKLVGKIDTMEMLFQQLQGIAEEDMRQLTHHSISNDGKINLDDVQYVLDFKRQKLGKSGLLEFYTESINFSELGGLDVLKGWLDLRKAAFTGDDKSLGVDPPKGILLLGVQGSGKSLAAKCVAGSWNVPLLRLDFGSLYAKYLGDSEHNVRDVLIQAEAMAPCVLWIDEIEKGITSDGSGSTDGGVSRRLLATILTWMAEHKAKVFLVATANDVSQLPPELLRKGRMDEIFFVDLPNREIRSDILRIHLNKRKLNPVNFSLEKIAEACEGFSGAEIEQAIVAAIYVALSEHITVNTEHIINEMHLSKPLSILMSEKIAKLRQWALGRTVLASSEKVIA
jgi:hypothetical protein